MPEADPDARERVVLQKQSIPHLSIRWTIGDVHARGFEALRLSLLGAWKVFGSTAIYTVCVNTIRPEDALSKVGDIPQPITWRPVSRDDVPACVRRWIGRNMAEGAAWKLAPVRLYPDRHELALDNDCILWGLPQTLDRWLATDGASVLAEDVRCAFGQFADELAEPRNCGLIGLPPRFDYEAALQHTLERHPVMLSSELDEQGLQAVTLSRSSHCLAVPMGDVSICSPFHPATTAFGRCGAHFVGINTHDIPWDYYDRPADAWIEEHWARSRPALERLVQAEAVDGWQRAQGLADPMRGMRS